MHTEEGKNTFQGVKSLAKTQRACQMVSLREVSFERVALNSQCPFVFLGSSPATDDATWELHTLCRTWNLVMEIGSKHRATCSPFSQAGTRSQLGHTPWPCELPAAAVRISPGSCWSPKHMCLMCPWGLGAARAQFKGLSEANQIPASLPWLLLFLLLNN